MIKLDRQFGPAGVTARAETPIEPKAGAMPTDHGFRLDENQRGCPVRPDGAQGDPKEAIGAVEMGTRVLAFEDGELLAEGENLQRGVVAGTEERAEVCQGGSGGEHGIDIAQL